MSNAGPSAGGKANAILQRNAAIHKYYQSPNRCLTCQGLIHVGKEKVSETRRRKFCNKSCAGIFNNKHRKKAYHCACGSRIQRTSIACRRCTNFGREPMVLKTITKSDLFDKRKNWQSARGSIQSHARQVYMRSGLPKKCRVCGYSNHFQVAHLRPVSDFPAGSRIQEHINAIHNLVALCPNHHWEFDHGIISVEQLLFFPVDQSCGILPL